MTAFRTSTDRLLTQISHWEQPRWSAEGRADRVFALLQTLADLAATAEGREGRLVPREHDMVLPDQLRVIADDLEAAAPAEPLLDSATAAVDEVRRAL